MTFILQILSDGDEYDTRELDATTLDEAEKEVGNDPDRDGGLPYHVSFEIADENGDTLSEWGGTKWERSARMTQ